MPPKSAKPKDPRHVPAKGEKLQPGRTDLYIGDLVVAWIEWFPDAALGYVRHATGDGAFATGSAAGAPATDSTHPPRNRAPPACRMSRLRTAMSSAFRMRAKRRQRRSSSREHPPRDRARVFFREPRVR